MEADASFTTCNFISEGTFRFFWRISMICLYLNTNPSSVFKQAESYRFRTHQERSKLTVYISKNCHAPDIIPFSNGTSLSLPLILDQVWREDLGAFLKHHFQKRNGEGHTIQLPGSKYHTTWPIPYLCEHIFPHSKFPLCSSSRISQ